MQKQNVGKTYGPIPVFMSGAQATELAQVLGIQSESVTRNGEIAVGVVPAVDGRELFATMFNDLTDDGIGNSARRLAAGTEYHYDGVLTGDREYASTGHIVSIEEREGRTGLYQYGTMETAYATETGAAPVLRVRITFAERQGDAVQRSRPPAAAPAADPSGELPEWSPPPYTNESILQYVLIVDDRNPNHRDDDYARSNGFPQRIASGGMTWNLLGEYVSRLCGVANVASISFRLTQPIYPGQALRITGRINRESDLSGRRMEARLSADGTPVAFAIAILREPIG